MAVEARISAIWSKQKLFVALFFLAFSVWFYVDGAYKYPHSNERLAEYERFAAEKRSNEWPAYAASRNWVADKPEKHYDRSAIIMQYIFGGLGTILGGLLLTYWFTQRKRRLRLEDSTVITPSGSRVPFSAIRGLGKKKWESKGIAIVRYEDNGRLLQFVVDDYKYETEPAHQIVNEIEQHLTATAPETPAA